MNNPAQDFTPATIHTLPSAPQNIDEEDVDIGEFIGLLWSRKWFILLSMLLMMLVGIFYVRQIPPLYPAEATLILESEEPNTAGLETLVPGLSDDDAEMNSQIEIIKSSGLIGKVVDELSLDKDPEFVPYLRDPSMRKQATDAVKSILGLDSEKEIPSSARLRQDAIDRLTENLNASVLPNTYVFNISLETRDPAKSVKIVNALSQAFVKDQITAKNNSTADAADWLRNKVADLGKNLEAAEAKSAEFRTSTERAVTEIDLAQSNLNLKNARGRKESFISTLEATTGSKIATTDRDITRMNALIRDESELAAIVKKQTEDLLTIRQLDREAVAAGKIYEHFATRLNEVEVQKGLQKSDIRVLTAAVPRLTATKPRTRIMVAFFTILGLIGSVGYILLRKFMDRSFSDPAALQRAFDIPVIGTIARAPMTSRQALLNYVMKRPSSRVMESIRDLRTSLLTSSRSGRQSSEAGGTVVVFTSSIPAEGKTTSSVLLAVNSAALNQKVLLVECDLRRSTFKTYFGPQTELGLVDALQGDNWEDAIWVDRKTDQDRPPRQKSNRPRTNMDIIFGGVSKNKNAADVFASQEFELFIERVREKYDLIILDAPPVLPVPDARLIAKLSDKIVYVVSAGKTASSTVSAGLRSFNTMNLKPDGLVLTQIKKGQSYSYGGYGYGSQRYGSEYYNN